MGRRENEVTFIARFAKTNARIGDAFDRVLPFPPETAGELDAHEPAQLFVRALRIADVGGGKKPFAVAASLDSSNKDYVGFDLDGDELKQAPVGVYSDVRVMDICRPDSDLAERFDLILCRNTLEHVLDTSAALEGLSFMLAPGGYCFLELPYRNAVFARLNMVLPNEFKRRVLHAVFPHKRGDGFPAYYDQCLPSRVEALAAGNGLEKIAEKRHYRSTYFGFFLPLYLVWRMITVGQYLFDRNYCERFEMVLHKPVGGSAAPPK